MFDDMNPGPARDGREGHKDAPQHTRKSKEQEVRSVVDREVPLGSHEDRVLAPAVHSWLDGELPEAAVRDAFVRHEHEWQSQRGADPEQNADQLTVRLGPGRGR